MLSSVESPVRPISTKRTRSNLALNEVFGTRGQVHLLRILTTETDGSIASPEVAARVGMTPSGARKALRRLARAGVVQKVGRGKATRYVLCRDNKLAQEISRLFELEKKVANPSWTPRREVEAPVPGNGEATQAPSNGNEDLSESRRSQVPNLKPGSREFQAALVSMLEEDLSLIRRAREKVAEKLEHRHPGNGHDDWEWRKILDTFPLPRLLSFLESDSPRAVRLRESSPFPEVMSEREKERLESLVERVH